MNYLIAGYEDKCQNYIRAIKNSGDTCEVSLDTAYICEQTIQQWESGKPSPFSALLLPGGGDINPRYFRQQNNGSDPPDTALDEAQFKILEIFVYYKKPVLGICRGHQIINVFFGGDIIQDLPKEQRKLHTSDSHDMLHTVHAQKDSWVGTVFGETFLINSRHHQAVGKIGGGLKAAAWSEDGIAEAISHEYLPIYGIQWHPERMPQTQCVSGENDKRTVFGDFPPLAQFMRYIAQPANRCRLKSTANQSAGIAKYL